MVYAQFGGDQSHAYARLDASPGGNLSCLSSSLDIGHKRRAECRGSAQRLLCFTRAASSRVWTGRPHASGSIHRSNGQRGPSSGAAATTVATRPQTRFTAETDAEFYRRKKSSIVVRHVSGDRMVAVLEVVSPGTRPAGTRSALWLRKRANCSNAASTS